MTKLAWDVAGERRYETGVDRAVLYIPDETGDYNTGFAWNGVETVTESPSGAEATATYADNIKYLNLISLEQFGATLEAYTYPDEFGQCDGSAAPVDGVTVGQQTRKTFGLSYRTRVGNDLLGSDLGYKLHLVYGATAAPSEKAYASINDSPSALSFSWTLSTIPVEVTGLKPTSTMTIDSTRVDSTALGQLEDILYGTVGTDPRLPQPDEVIALFSGTVTVVTPTAPTYTSGTHTIVIPTVTGVVYKIGGEIVTGSVVITEDTIVTAEPTAGHVFPAVVDDDWFFDFV